MLSISLAMCATLAAVVIPADTFRPLKAFPFSTRKVGGLRFVKLGRLTVSYSIAKAYKPL